MLISGRGPSSIFFLKKLRLRDSFVRKAGALEETHRRSSRSFSKGDMLAGQISSRPKTRVLGPQMVVV